MKTLKGITEGVALKAQLTTRAGVGKANALFNGLSARGKKTVLLIFGSVMGGISIMLIMQALGSQENTESFRLKASKHQRTFI